MIFAIVGPSGAGKDTLIAGACARRPDLRLVQRVITRDGADGTEPSLAVTPAVFARRKAQGDFALDWQAHGLSYGIPADQLAGPGPVVFNGSRAALPDALARLPDLRVIVVTAPPDVLAARLARRGRETADDIRGRLQRAHWALPQVLPATVMVNDGTPDQGIARLLAAMDAALAAPATEAALPQAGPPAACP